MSLSMDSLKREYRKSIINEWKSFNSEQMILFTQHSQNMVRFVKQLMQKRSGLWAAFKPLRSEPQIDFDLVLPAGFCYPKVHDADLEFYNNITQWSVSDLGVKEPLDGVQIDRDTLAGVFVPGLAVHKSGRRLGRGAGFYDRALQGFDGLKVGLCFEKYFRDDVPYADWDLQLDLLITENNLIYFNRHITGEF